MSGLVHLIMDPTSTSEENLAAVLLKLRELVPSELLTPKVAIVCGSGLSTLGSVIVDRVDVAFTELPGFLTSQGMLFSVRIKAYPK
jgi:purine nucleoside phosphorylase